MARARYHQLVRLVTSMALGVLLAPLILDWPAIGARVNQLVGEAVGKRAGEPTCDRKTAVPEWVAQTVGVSKDAALAVRACEESEGDVLVIELVNNRPYGQVLTYGSDVKWGWREEGDSASDKARNAIMSGVLGGDKLYLPPKGRASVGIQKIAAGKMAEFHIGIERATLVGDLLDVVAPELLAKAGRGLVGPLLAECGTALATSVPITKLTSPSEIREQMFRNVDCVKEAFFQEVRDGSLDKVKVEELAETLDALKTASVVGWLLKAYDVEWQLLDLYVDTRLVPEVPGLGYGFSVRSKSEMTSPESAEPAHGFTVEDSYFDGTWARHDPDDGTWHSRDNKPDNAAYWFKNGLGIAVDCARSAAAYEVKTAGQVERWSWWLHVTDNTWIPAAAVRESSADGSQGVNTC